jgi:hypothetical protein
MGLKKLVAIFLLLSCIYSHAQVRISVAPDLSLMRNFSPKQEFWSLGQTVQFNFHFSAKESGYAWITYYTPGKFKNNFTATAKSSTTSPFTIPFTASAKWRNNEVSLGWKHYFQGSYDTEAGYNIYGLAGFGLMFTKVENIFSPAIDTSLYTTPTLAGNSEFKRLTIDLGAGVEFPIGGNFFLYSDVRTWIPTTNYPSPYLHNNENVPLPFMISGGMRILFGY